MTSRLDHFIPFENIVRAAQAIAKLEPCPFAGRVTVDQVVATMGEFGDIWPDNIREDLIREAIEDASRRYTPRSARTH